jgi:hypothetical protein
MKSKRRNTKMARVLTEEEENTGFMALYNQIDRRGRDIVVADKDDDYSNDDDSFEDDFCDDEPDEND